MGNALFINGMYDDVLSDILKAQTKNNGGEYFLQPYKRVVIKFLQKYKPSTEDPIRLYLSTTKNLSQISYVAEVVRWENKKELSEERRLEVAAVLKKNQQGEVDYFMNFDENAKKGKNLITVRALKQLDSLYSTSILRKVSDDLPLKKRTRAGGWSEVYDIGDLVNLPVVTQDQLDSDLSAHVEEASSLSDEILREKIASANRIPERIQVISVGYRRNPNIIVATLRRAKGICERCGGKAPFSRRSDGTPYLETHHWIPLSQGGEDVLENAAALCPNCHRELHYGQADD